MQATGAKNMNSVVEGLVRTPAHQNQNFTKQKTNNDVDVDGYKGYHSSAQTAQVVRDASGAVTGYSITVPAEVVEPHIADMDMAVYYTLTRFPFGVEASFSQKVI